MHCPSAHSLPLMALLPSAVREILLQLPVFHSSRLLIHPQSCCIVSLVHSCRSLLIRRGSGFFRFFRRIIDDTSNRHISALTAVCKTLPLSDFVGKCRLGFILNILCVSFELVLYFSFCLFCVYNLLVQMQQSAFWVYGRILSHLNTSDQQQSKFWQVGYMLDLFFFIFYFL